MKKISATDRRLLDAMQEAVRGALKLRLEQKDPMSKKIISARPFFSSLSLKESFDQEIMVSSGSIFKKDRHCFKKDSIKRAHGELKVGDYDLGCYTESFLPDFPYDKNPLAIKRSFWKESNEAFWDALKGLRNNITQSMGSAEKYKTIEYFTKEKRVEHYNPPIIEEIDFDYWENILKKTSRLFLRDEILDSLIRFSYIVEKRYFVNSEGTELIDFFPILELAMNAHLLSKDSCVLDDQEVFRARKLSLMPTEEQIRETAERLLKNLFDLRKASIENGDVFPVIADGLFHGLIWHEVFGHAAEAQRVEEEDDDCESEGEEKDLSLLTLKGKLGQKVAPSFLTVIDDPTLPDKMGSYRYDEEGVPAKRVVLVKNGILEDLLFTRRSAAKFSKIMRKKKQSNGHARAAFVGDPAGRMSNLLISSEHQHSLEELKEMCFKHCREKNLSYALLLEDFIRGVSVSSSHFSVHPKRIFRLWPNGKIERVRGIYVGGNPYQLMGNMVATSNKYSTSHGFCGAESGYIPVTQTAPDVFIDSVGFGVIPRAAYSKRKPLLSRPPNK